MSNLELNRNVQRIMQELSGLFPSNYRLTFIARNNATAEDRTDDVMATNDNLDRAIAALEFLKQRQLNGGGSIGHG